MSYSELPYPYLCIFYSQRKPPFQVPIADWIKTNKLFLINQYIASFA